jgi:hypothetical protein
VKTQDLQFVYPYPLDETLADVQMFIRDYNQALYSSSWGAVSVAEAVRGTRPNPDESLRSITISRIDLEHWDTNQINGWDRYRLNITINKIVEHGGTLIYYPRRQHTIIEFGFYDKQLLDFWKKLKDRLSGNSTLTRPETTHRTPDLLQKPLAQIQENNMPQNWFPSDLIIPLRDALLDCGPFSENRQLRAVFSHPALKPWRDRLPGADSVQDRVDLTIDFLLNQYTSDGVNVLILFLQLLSERINPADACHNRLAELADTLDRAYRGDTLTSTNQVAATTNPEEITSLKRQLIKLKRNLLTIEEQKTEFIDPRSVPPDLAESEKLIREKIAQIEARLAELETSSNERRNE